MSKPNTKFEPFNLQTENRGARKAELWAKKVELLLQQLMTLLPVLLFYLFSLVKGIFCFTCIEQVITRTRLS